MPDKAKFFEDKKFMWDGALYESEKEALEKKGAYERERFETRLVPDDSGKFLVYTRRVVTEVKTG